jgi:hypothetical protein
MWWTRANRRCEVTHLELMRAPEGVRLSGAAREQALEEFMNPEAPRANVLGFGHGVKWTGREPTGKAAVLVFVTQKLPQTVLLERDVIPPRMKDGTPTDVVALGHVVAQQQAVQTPAAETNGHAVADLVRPPEAAPHVEVGPLALRRRMRPCPAGLSIGNVAITAGTLAGAVYDFQPGASVDPPAPGIGTPSQFYVLSNNHVLAASNAAPLGSAIVQPGPFDGGADPQDRIATLSRFIPIQFAPTIPLDRQQNVVDCAVGVCDFQDATREIYFNGPPRGWRRKANVAVADLVRKTGRTTNTSFGRIVSVDATIDVGFGAAGTARFRDQIVTTNISAGGDSGSLVTTLDNVAVGLLFAGSTQSTIINHFENVRTLLRIEIAEQLL